MSWYIIRGNRRLGVHVAPKTSLLPSMQSTSNIFKTMILSNRKILRHISFFTIQKFQQ